MTEPLRLASLTVYPVKSAAGLSVRSWQVDSFGLQHDRRWMVTDVRGRQVTQRERPGLALVRPSLGNGTFRLSAPDMPVIELPLSPSGSAGAKATVWGDVCEAVPMDTQVSGWFSRYLSIPCTLVYMPEATHRPVDPAYGSPDARVSFADAFPFLLLSEASLADLNTRLPQPVPMNRFRPNLVLAGGDPYVEDALTRFRLGTIEFEVVKPCARCVLTTTDQATGRRGPEPLRTLAGYRRVGGDVRFGQNVLHRTTGVLRVGQALRV